MRDIIRLSITLTLVGIVSAAVLTAFYNLTEPIIIARQEEDYRRALEQFFPGFDTFDTETLDEGDFDLIYDDDGDLMGIMATAIAMGYDGEIRFNLAVSDEGEIKGLRIVSHTETPGIGDVIERDSFKEQFVGKSFEDPITAGQDVDIITGATVSCVAMINGVRQTIGVVAQNFLGVEVEEVDIASVPDGVYQGSAQGFMGPIEVEVEVSGGEIISIEVIDHEETPTYFIEAYPLIPEQIKEQQSFDVDTSTGATASAQGIVDAVQNALLKALGVEDDVEEAPEEEPGEIDLSAVPDGTYQGSADGFKSTIVVEVVVEGGAILSVEVLEHDDTPEYFRDANPLIPDQIVEEQNLDVDTQTGATRSAEGIVNAVRDALSGALDNGGGGDDS